MWSKGLDLVSFFDGLGLGWVVNRNSEQARAALDGFVDGLALMASPRSEVDRRRSHRTPASATGRPQAAATTALASGLVSAAGLGLVDR